MKKLYLLTILLFSTSCLFAQLSGSYTIDPLGSGTSNYASFSAAATALSSQGVSSAVVFYVAPGTYNEQVLIDSIPGTTSNRTVTFRPDSQATASVIIEFAPACSSPYVVRIQGADWVTFDNLEISNTETSSCSHALSVLEHSNDVTIQNCNLQCLATTSTSDLAAVLEGSGKVENLAVLNNAIEAGSIGILAKGTSSTGRLINPKMEGNELTNNYSCGIEVRLADAAVAQRNRVSATSAIASFACGISFTDCSQLTVASNYIGSDAGVGFSTCLELDNCYEGLFGERNKVINNCLNAGVVNSTSNGFYGLYLNNSGDVDIYNNTINRRGGSSSTIYAGVRINQGGVIDFRNNSVSTFANSALITSGVFIFISCDYNHYYSGSGNAFRSGFQSYPSLSSWQNVSSLDLHSVSGGLSFLDELQCRTCEPILNAGGTPLGVAIDIDSTVRHSTEPDIGAFEFIETTEVVLPQDDTLCTNLVELGVGSGGYSAIQWVVNGLPYSTDTVLLDATASCEAMDFSVSLFVNSDYCGSTTFDEDYTLIPPIEFDFPDSMHLCVGEEVTIGACISSTATYQWSTGAATDSITVNDEGIYILSQSNSSCTTSDTVTITASAAVVLADTETCEAGTFITYDATIPFGSSYAWNGGITPDQAVNSFDVTGIYHVLVTDSFGCSQTDTVEVYLLSPPTADITWFQVGLDFTFLSQSSFQISPSTEYTWLIDNYPPIDSAIALATYPFPINSLPLTVWNVTLIVDNGCGIDTAYEAVVPTINGLPEVEDAFSLNIFPNPVESTLRVMLPEQMLKAQVMVFNLAGQQLLQTSAGQLQQGLDVSRLPSGIYSLQVYYGHETLRQVFLKR